MNIHPLWFLCLTVRLSLILTIYHFNKKSQNDKKAKTISLLILFIIGISFIRKGFVGSNNEVQIAKVFWHETRYVHGILYILSGLYLLNDNLKMCSLILLMDVIFSILYRFLLRK